MIEAAARERFAALFVTHDLAEAVRVAHRLVVLAGDAKGLIASRVIEGRPGERDDRAVFAIVEAWSRDPEFREVFDGERERAR